MHKKANQLTAVSEEVSDSSNTSESGGHEEPTASVSTSAIGAIAFVSDNLSTWTSDSSDGLVCSHHTSTFVQMPSSSNEHPGSSSARTMFAWFQVRTAASDMAHMTSESASTIRFVVESNFHTLFAISTITTSSEHSSSF